MPTPPRQPGRRVLMLTHRVPYPPDRGDRIRSYHLLRQLARHTRVSLACLSDAPPDPAHAAHLATLTEQLAVVPLRPLRSRARAAAALLTGRAITPSLFCEPALARTVRRWHAAQPFDAVLVFCTGMSRCADALGAPRPRRVLDLVDVDSLKWASYADAARPPMRWVYRAEASRLRRVERAVDAEAVTVISDAEAAAYLGAVGEHPGLRVVGNGVDVDYFVPQPDVAEPVITFVGVLSYRPNAEGIAWFVREVLPRVRERVAGARLRIVGRDPGPTVCALSAAAGVEVVGPVDDVRTELAKAAVVVAPLRMARGVQNKVLEAMASARPVVCTPAGAEGIDAEAGEHLFIADDPETYAAQVVRLLGDAAMRQRVGCAARQRVEARYAWAAAARPMVELLVT